MTRRLPTVVLWAAAVCAVGVLAWTRLGASLAGANAGYDFRTFYSAAAGAFQSGGSPLDINGYVYSPLVSLAVSWLLRADEPLLWWNVAGIAFGITALLATWRAYSSDLAEWRGPAFVAVGAVLLFWTWPVTLELFYGQSDMIVLALFALAVLASTRGRPALVGGAIGLAALVKTWPIVAIVYVWRRGATGRGRAIAVTFAVLAAGAVAFAGALGPSIFRDWYHATESNSVQPHLSYSAFGLGRDLFSQGQQLEPLLISPALRWAVTGVLSLWVVLLALITLRRPHDDRLAFWHLVACGLLLLPVSHWFYLILLVPITWTHLIRLLGGRIDIGGVGVGLVVMAWWFVACRTLDQGRAGYVSVVAMTFIMLTVSVLRDARLWRPARSPEEASETRLVSLDPWV